MPVTTAVAASGPVLALARYLASFGRNAVACHKQAKTKRSRNMDTIKAQTLNVGLARLHSAFFIAYTLFYLVGLFFLFFPEEGSKRDAYSLLLLLLLFMFFAAFPLVHYFAAKGARAGKSYGKVCTRVIACFWLLGFPIGTALAIYAFYKTSNNEWQSETEDGSRD